MVRISTFCKVWWNGLDQSINQLVIIYNNNKMHWEKGTSDPVYGLWRTHTSQKHTSNSRSVIIRQHKSGCDHDFVFKMFLLGIVTYNYTVKMNADTLIAATMKHARPCHITSNYTNKFNTQQYPVPTTDLT